MLCDHSLKKQVFIILVVVLFTFCWTNISAAMSSKIRLLFWRVAVKTFVNTFVNVNTFTFLCVYDEDSFTQIKWWNAHEVTLRAVLEMSFVCLCPRDVTRASVCVCVCVCVRGLHGLKTEARTRPVPEIVWPNPTRPERHG